MMGEKKALKARFIKMIVAAVIIVLVIMLMSVLKCNMATPAY
ncbi:MAG: hypothetical protein ACYTFW_07660 [Planctomycetota bacterium]